MTIDELLDLAAQAPGWRVQSDGLIRSDCGCPIAAAAVVRGLPEAIYTINRILAGAYYADDPRPTIAQELTDGWHGLAEDLGVREVTAQNLADAADSFGLRLTRRRRQHRARMLARFGLTEVAP